MKTACQKQRKNKKNSPKKSDYSQISQSSNREHPSSLDVSIQNLEEIIKVKLSRKDSEKNTTSDETCSTSSILVSSSPCKIVLSKENYYLYEVMQPNNNYSGAFLDKELENYFSFAGNINQQIPFCFESGRLYKAGFTQEEDKQNEYLNLTKMFYDKKIKNVDKLSFGKNPQESLNKIVNQRGENDDRAISIRNIISNFPVFIYKESGEQISMPMDIDPSILKNELNILNKETQIEERQEEENSKEGCGGSGTNETEVDSKTEKDKLFKIQLKRVNVKAKKKLCEYLGENYDILIKTNEGKIKLKKLISENNKEFRNIKKKFQNKKVENDL